MSILLKPNQWRILAITTLLSLQLVQSQHYQCTLEKFDSDGEYCVFRDVDLSKNMAGAIFAYPAGIAKPSQVSFVDSYMKEIPPTFLTLASPELKVLRVEGCGLETVTIASGLEALHAKDNYIEEVIVNQNGSEASLRTLDLSGNQLSNVINVTKCQALELLNLSGNNLGDTLDLGKFKGLNKLRQLDLSNNEINYLDNNGNVNLESLEDLNLSHNNIIPKDLYIEIFYPYTALHTLRLNDNTMAQLDYNYLLNIKPLKTVYLNGNNFKCDYLDAMLKHLQQNNLQTPVGDYNSCFDKTMNDFCCTGPLPKITTPNPESVSTLEPIQDWTTTESTRSSSPGTIPPEITTSTESQNNNKIVQILEKYNWFNVVVICVVIAVSIVVIILVNCLCCQRKSQQTRIYRSV